jgi:hypothetical protein
MSALDAITMLVVCVVLLAATWEPRADHSGEVEPSELQVSTSPP